MTNESQAKLSVGNRAEMYYVIKPQDTVERFLRCVIWRHLAMHLV